MSEIIAGVFLIVGSVFSLVSTIGVLRFPGLFTRMHASSKASSFGIGWIIVGTAIAFGTLSASIKAVIIIFFIVITVPLAPHLLGRGEWVERQKKGIDNAD